MPENQRPATSKGPGPKMQIFAFLEQLQRTKFYGGFGTFVEFDPKVPSLNAFRQNLEGAIGERG